MIQTRILLMMMRMIVPRIESVRNHMLQDTCVTPEADTEQDKSQEECRMWQLRACNITQDVTNRGQHISMVPVRWVEGQKGEMLAVVRNIENLVIKTPVKMIKSGVASVNEDLQIRMWEMGWFIVLLVEKRVGQVKNMIIDTVEMAAGVVDIMKENPVNGILNYQKRPQSLEIMRNENLMKYIATVSKEHGNKKYAETDQFSLSDVDTKMFNSE